VIVETDRLVLRRLEAEDAPFMLALLNEPSFIQYIGDRGVRTIDEAVEYIAKGPQASYERYGFGLYLVELKGAQTPTASAGFSNAMSCRS
jgi:RimJ/RimL family protein N-acetyltransferase